MTGEKTTRRALLLVALIAATWWLPAGSGWAESGEFEDGNGEGESVDKIDIRTFSHDDDTGSITYGIKFLNPWPHTALTEIVWTLDFTPDNETADEDACVRITRGPAGQTELDGSFLDGCSDSIADDVEVTHESNTDEMTVVYPKVLLAEANDDKGVKEYAYRIVATDSDTGANRSSDFAPDVTEDRVVHRLGAAQGGGGTPKPAPRVPTPTEDPDDGSVLGSDDDSSDESSDDSDAGSDDVEVLSASVRRAELPNTGGAPDAGDRSSLVISAGTSLLSIGVLLRWAARRTKP